MAKLKITLTKSLIGYNRTQKLTARALGLNKVGSSVTQEDSPSIMGAVTKLIHAVRVEAVAEPAKAGSKASE